MLTETSPSRITCRRCLRPTSACVCSLATPTAHRTEVLVLQHPQEQRQAKNSVALLRLSLSHCEVVVGEQFDAVTLRTLLHRPGRRTCLLYPDTPLAPAVTTVTSTASHAPTRLVVIDATWRKSLRMLLSHPELATLPRLALRHPPPTQYRAIRAARRVEQVSTLEATVQALTELDGHNFNGQPLLEAFGHFVDGVAQRVRHGHDGQAHRESAGRS